MEGELLAGVTMERELLVGVIMEGELLVGMIMERELLVGVTMERELLARFAYAPARDFRLLAPGSRITTPIYTLKIPSRIAITTIPAVFRTFIFSWMRSRWPSTVRILMPSLAAISLLDSSSQMRRMMAFSFSV